MPKIEPIQNNFSGGEISPLVFARSDLGLYAASVATMENMLPNSRGPAIRREGSKFIERYSGNDGTVETLTIDDNRFAVLIWLDSIVYIASTGGTLPATNLTTEPRFDNGGAAWTVRESHALSEVLFAPNDCSLTPRQLAADYAGIAQQITTSAPATDHILRIDNEGGTVLTINVGSTEGASDIYSTTTTVANFMETITPPAATFWVTIDCYYDAANTPTEAHVNYVAVYEEASTGLSFVTPYSETETKDLHFIPVPQGGALYVLHEAHDVYKLAVDSNDNWTFAAVTFTGKPTEWTGANWPSTGAYFQGRLWLASTPAESETFWASKSGLPEDFTQGPDADDGLQFTLEKQGRIRWMYGTKNLLLGTANAEHIINSEAGVITPGDVQVQQQSAYGSNKLQVEQIGDQVFYISPDGLKVRGMQYEFANDNWLSQDITFASEHITATGIIDVCWVQNPANMYVGVLSNGDIAALIYERGNGIAGWARLTGQGEAKSAAIGTINGSDIVITLAQRIDGSIDLNAYDFAHILHTVQEHQETFMDSWIESSHDPEVTTITGLDHLEGFTVQVLTDGAVHPERVVSSGQITLQWPANLVVVGLAFVSRLTTLPVDSQGAGGTTRHMIKHWNKLYIELLDSALPIVNGVRQPTREPATPMDERQPDKTGTTSTLTLGRTAYAQITIEQDLPLGLTVVALYGELGQNSL